MKPSRYTVPSLLLLFLLCGPVSGEDPWTTDTARDTTEMDTLWSSPTSLEMHPDSTRKTGFADAWLYPAGVIIATGITVFLLFAVRSR